MKLLRPQTDGIPPHPRQEPRVDGPLTVDTLRRAFADCVDFAVREADLAGDPEKHVTMCYIGLSDSVGQVLKFPVFYLLIAVEYLSSRRNKKSKLNPFKL